MMVVAQGSLVFTLDIGLESTFFVVTPVCPQCSTLHPAVDFYVIYFSTHHSLRCDTSTNTPMIPKSQT